MSLRPRPVNRNVRPVVSESHKSSEAAIKIIPSGESTQALLGRISILLFVYALAILNWKIEILRISFDLLNYVFFLAALCLPAMALLFSLRFPKLWMKVAGLTCLVPLMVGSGILAFLTVMVIPDVARDNEPALRHRVKTVASAYYNLGVYYSDYVVTVRQEKQILPGLLLVRQVYSTPGTEIELNVVDQNSIKVMSIIDPASQGGKVLQLKSFVYF